MPMSDKFLDYMTQNHISILKNSEIVGRELIEPEKFSAYPLYENLNEVIDSFTKAYARFDNLDDLLLQSNYKNEFDLSVTADLRYNVETLFYAVKEAVKKNTTNDLNLSSLIFVCLKYITSIFANAPKLFTEEYKCAVLKFAESEHIL